MKKNLLGCFFKNKVAVFLVCFFLLGGGVFVGKELFFKFSCPNPADATEMKISQFATQSVIFQNEDTCIAYLGKESDITTCFPLTDGNLEVLFLSEIDNELLDDIATLGERGWSVDTVYVPKGASKDDVGRLKELLSDSEVVQLKKKGKRFVLGEFVVDVHCVTDTSIAFSVTHGYNEFLVAADDIHGLESLKKTPFKIAFTNFYTASNLKNVEYFVCLPYGAYPALEEVSHICKHYTTGNRGVVATHDGKEVTILYGSFEPTGK